MMYKEPIVQLIEISLNSRNSEETAELLAELPMDNEEANSEFCYRIELGNWFYDSMILNDISIRKELERIGMEKIDQESEDREEVRDQQESWA